MRVAGFGIHRCAACDLEFVHPMPTRAELERFYESAYFHGPGHGYEDYFGAERTGSDAKAVARLERLKSLGLRAGSRTLDFGCADGRFVLGALSAGHDSYGVEVSDTARAHALPSVAPRVWASLDAARASAPFDLITLWDVLEHIPDALGLLRELRSLLAHDGWIGVVCPVIDNLNARWLPRTWDQYKPPEHVWFFSRRSLRAMLERGMHAAVVDESSAWQRDGRVTEHTRFARSRIARVVRPLDRAVWRTLTRTGLIRREQLQDSVMLIARASASGGLT